MINTRRERPSPDLRTERRVTENLPSPPAQIVVPFDVDGVGSTISTAFTVPDGQLYRLEKLVIHNPNAAARDVDVWIVPDGGSAATANLAYQASVPIGGTVSVTELEGLLLGGGVSLRHQSSADTLNMFISCTQIISGS